MFLEKIPMLIELNVVSIACRIVLAIILGGIVGFEREIKQRPAGFRTYVIVCLGATLATITNIYMCQYLTSSDPARIPAQVISGIGFLGAGTILVTRNNHIKGLTTAAGLWCCATIGIAIGSGFYTGAIICSLGLMITLRSLALVDKRSMRFNRYMNLYVNCEQESFIRELLRYTRKNNYKLYDLEIYPATQKTSCYCIFTVKTNTPGELNNLISELEQLEGCLIVEELPS